MAFPTAVNSQITDAVTQPDSTPVSDADQPTSSDKGGNGRSGQNASEDNEKGNGFSAEDHGTGNGYTAADGHEGGNGLTDGGGDGAGI